MKDSARLYFAYGSNLNRQDWDRWCREQGWPADLLRPVGVAFVPDRELAFEYRSTTRGGGVLNIPLRAGQAVAGVLFDVAAAGWNALDHKEGVPSGCYRRLDTVALTADGREVPVTTYEVCPDRRQPFVAPSDRYLHLVAEGLEGYGLDDAMLTAAARGKTPSVQIQALFVYGTLMRGECRHNALSKHDVKCILLAQVPGKLVDLGEYPGMLASDDGAEWVEGEFVRVDDIGLLLENLDRVEGFMGFGEAGSLYRRALIEVGVGEGRSRMAWTYLYNGPVREASEIPSGSWRERRKRRDSFLEALATAHCSGRDENEVARQIASLGKFPPISGVDVDASHLLPIANALRNGQVSERRLAHATGQWVVIPDPDNSHR